MFQSTRRVQRTIWIKTQIYVTNNLKTPFSSKYPLCIIYENLQTDTQECNWKISKKVWHIDICLLYSETIQYILYNRSVSNTLCV